uniref:WD_REPEATS_REGION domain-containing protein n=1 Tax=Trichuris muris TaxID=70415 RepID=A0A5S6QRZ9_TRIMR
MNHPQETFGRTSSTVDSVMQILRKKNLLLTEKSLLAELSEVDGSGPSVGPVRDSDVDIPKQYSFRETAYTVDCDLTLCLDEYDRFLQWVTAVEPERFRAELCVLLFPLFAHLCIDLLSSSKSSIFRTFLDRFSAEQKPFYAEYIGDLERLRSIDDLANSPVVQALRSNRFVVCLSMESKQKLLSMVGHLRLISAVLQSHVCIYTHDGPPRTDDVVKRISGCLTGECPPTISQSRVHDGIFRFVPNPEVLEFASACLGHGEPPSELLKIDQTLGTLQATANSPALDRIPLPSMSKEMQIGQLLALLDEKKRKPLGADAKASIYFYTILDQVSSPCCFDVTDDSELLAVGNGDSSLSLYALSPSTPINGYLQRFEGKSRLLGHSGAVYGVSCQSDKRLLFSCSADGSCLLWSLERLRLLNVYGLGPSPLWDVASAPFGGYFATAGANAIALVWNVERKSPVRVLQGHYSDLNKVIFHPNGNYVATASDDRTARLWDLRNGQCVRFFTGPKSSIQSITFSHAGNSLASGTLNGEVLCWNIGQARLTENRLLHKKCTYALAYSMEDSLLASGSLDDTVTLSNVTEGAAAQLCSFQTKSVPVLHLHFTRANLLLGFGHLGIPSEANVEDVVDQTPDDNESRVSMHCLSGR